MSASIADILQRSRGERPADPAPEAEPEEEYPCYATLRGVRQAAFMLELRLASGDGEAFDYGLLGRVQFDPSAGLTLHFAAGRVVIQGKNLRPLFEGVAAHRVTWVREADDLAKIGGDPEATVVSMIAVEATGG